MVCPPIWVVIPAYNEAQVLSGVLGELLDCNPYGEKLSREIALQNAVRPDSKDSRAGDNI